MEKNILKKIIIENIEIIRQKKVINRNIRIDKKANYVITGPRRVGKTYLLYQIIKDLLKAEKNKDKILFINFEDERLIEFNVSHFDLLLEAFRELFNVKPVLFLDEVQNIKGWEKFARRLSDTGYRVFVTGSNAKLLSKEIASTLGGRFLIKEIHPLSFKEYLEFNEIKLKNNYAYSSQRYVIKKHLKNYLHFGGFPELINHEYKKEYLSNLFQKVIYGDIVARYKIKNDFALKLLIKKLAENTNNEISFNRLKNIIKSSGVSCGTNTLIEYFSYLSDNFFISYLKNYKSKLSEKESKKKYYFNDTGLLNLFLLDAETKLLETLVYNELKRKYKELYYYKQNWEIDFLLLRKELIQVSYSLKNYNTREREVSAIEKFIKKHKYKKLTIITYDEEEKINLPKGTIEVIPVWKWLLK